MPAEWSIDASGHFLRRDGQPWFLVADTGWQALVRLTGEEADHYLTVRAGQGFNSVLTVAFSVNEGVDVPNAAGDLPFRDLDVTRPEEAYWRHVDRFLGRAGELGLTVCLLPMWGRHWHDPEHEGRPFFDAGNARGYGFWLAERYRDQDVIWVLGGDRAVDTPAQRATIEALAAGIREAVADTQPITFHPVGHASSSDTFMDADWPDFHLVQSGHTGWGTPNYQLIEQDYAHEPVRPVMDGEPNYDNHPVMTPPRTPPLWEETDWRFTDADTRRAAYHATFAGAAGHVYGCNDVWQMYDPHARRQLCTSPTIPWRAALHLPGAVQMGHLATFVREVDISRWRPDQSVLRSGVGFRADHQRAMVRREGAGVLVYAPGGREVRLDLRNVPGRTFTSRWWDPCEGRWLPGPAVDGDCPVLPHVFPGDDGVLLLEP